MLCFNLLSSFTIGTNAIGIPENGIAVRSSSSNPYQASLSIRKAD